MLNSIFYSLNFIHAPGWRNGLRRGLKILDLKEFVGSNPTPGTRIKLSGILPAVLASEPLPPFENCDAFSKHIRQRRKNRGGYCVDSAKKADIKYTTLMKVESGTVNKPSVQTMAKIAKGLGVSIDDLIR